MFWMGFRGIYRAELHGRFKRLQRCFEVLPRVSAKLLESFRGVSKNFMGVQAVSEGLPDLLN